MPAREDRRALNFRALLQLAETPFATARYPRRTVIFCQGDACDTVMHIETGRVRLAVTTSDGKEGICGLLEAGAFLGDDVLGGPAVRRQTAVAMIDTQLIVIAKAQMLKLLHTKPAIEDLFIAHILARHTRLEAALTDQLLCSTEQRLAHTLVELAGCDGQNPCGCVLPQVSQEVIAEMIGTTRSRVNIFLGRFKKRGFIDGDGHGTIYVRPALVRVVTDGMRKLATRNPCAVVNTASRAARVR